MNQMNQPWPAAGQQTPFSPPLLFGGHGKTRQRPSILRYTHCCCEGWKFYQRTAGGETSFQTLSQEIIYGQKECTPSMMAWPRCVSSRRDHASWTKIEKTSRDFQAGLHFSLHVVYYIESCRLRIMKSIAPCTLFLHRLVYKNSISRPVLAPQSHACARTRIA